MGLRHAAKRILKSDAAAKAGANQYGAAGKIRNKLTIRPALAGPYANPSIGAAEMEEHAEMAQAGKPSPEAVPITSGLNRHVE